MRHSRTMAIVCFLYGMVFTCHAGAQGPGVKPWESWELRKIETQDRVCGISKDILQKQRLGRVVVPSLEDSIFEALDAADKAADPLIDRTYHTGKVLVVPEAFVSIQSAINAAAHRDIVLVKPGTYYEIIVMKDGVKLLSDESENGSQMMVIDGARLQLPKRTLRTIIDGSRTTAPNRGVLDFNEDVGRHTIVDGFTIQNLPLQDHHLPGHAHAINARGASPVITNCYVRNNGTTGIGSHVVYKDQDEGFSKRDFRWQNIKKEAAGVIFKNIVTGNVGLGIGCNHFSSPFVLGNEVFNNSDAQLGSEPSPGIGVKHGAFPTIIGNIVHDNPGGGILSKTGDPQGVYPVDRPTHPKVEMNAIFGNGNSRPALSAQGSGSEATPVQFIKNVIYNAGSVGIGLSDGAVGIVEANLISGSGSPGIEITRAIIIKLNRNQITGARGPGILIDQGTAVWEMVDNAADNNQGPRFMLRGGAIGMESSQNHAH